MTNEDGITALEGETSGVLPGPTEREIMRQMLAEGDPTNGVERSDG
jgi:hypothetical protein